MKSTHDLPTFVYIDASNIRNACSRSSHFEIDFVKMITYLNGKYTDLRDVKYFEGVSRDDTVRKKELDTLAKIGYSIFSLERKSYTQAPIIKNITCSHCSNKSSVEVLKSKAMMKSNIDVFLASEFMLDASILHAGGHLLLISCDGDYAEMIKKIFNNFPNIKISVMATPMKKVGMNYLSSRFKELGTFQNYELINIENIRDYLAKK